MCGTCGCGTSNEESRIYRPGGSIKPVGFVVHAHSHDHEHHHVHDHNHSIEYHSHDFGKHIHIEQDILSANDKLAERNRGYFEAKKIFAINLVSSPGAGKTSLLELTLKRISSSMKCYVIEGDQQTDNDARRIEQTGVDVVQVNTGNGCHLDASMVHQAIHKLEPTDNSLLFIENVGNLVCPSMFDLGENYRVVIFSVTEGEDKPLKYPNIFHSSQLIIISKVDLLPYLDFNLNRAKENVRQINPHAPILEISTRSGLGVDDWLLWLEKRGKL
ncbi:MAG: hydrogenase nickel incorporation protein HypB [Bacteroidales bacterium]|nr:hydrogenase nickel incorporation protein HypB [Bacteroidales bacterium]